MRVKSISYELVNLEDTLCLCRISEPGAQDTRTPPWTWTSLLAPNQLESIFTLPITTHKDSRWSLFFFSCKHS